MRRRVIGWALLACLGGSAARVSAEEITLTTYYPSPRGVYQELRTTGTTVLATPDGNVGIGTATPSEKLEVNGGLRLNPQAAEGAKPACTAERRGTLWFEADAQLMEQTTDQLEFCALVNGQYRWVTILGVAP